MYKNNLFKVIIYKNLEIFRKYLLNLIKQFYFIFFNLFEIFIRETILILCFEFHKSIHFISSFLFIWLFIHIFFFLYKNTYNFVTKFWKSFFVKAVCKWNNNNREFSLFHWFWYNEIDITNNFFTNIIIKTILIIVY